MAKRKLMGIIAQIESIAHLKQRNMMMKLCKIQLKWVLFRGAVQLRITELLVLPILMLHLEPPRIQKSC